MLKRSYGQLEEASIPTLPKTYLDPLDNGIFVGVAVSGIHDTDGVGPALLGSSYCSPQYPFSASTSITAGQISCVRRALAAILPERMKESHDTLPVFIRLLSVGRRTHYRIDLLPVIVDRI